MECFTDGKQKIAVATSRPAFRSLFLIKVFVIKIEVFIFLRLKANKQGGWTKPCLGEILFDSTIWTRVPSSNLVALGISNSTASHLAENDLEGSTISLSR